MADKELQQVEEVVEVEMDKEATDCDEVLDGRDFLPDEPVEAKPSEQPISAEGSSRIYAIERRLTLAQVEDEAAGETKKSTAARVKLLQSELQSAVRDARGGQHSLFEQSSGDTPPGTVGVLPGVQECDESWRKMPVGSMGLPLYITDRLIASDILTIGALVDFQAKHGNTWDQELQGIGPAKRQKIDDAMETFWAGRNAPPAV